MVVIQAPSPLQRPLTGAAGKAEVCLQRLDLSPPSSAWKGQVWRWETPRAQSLSHKCLLVKKKNRNYVVLEKSESKMKALRGQTSVST